MLALASSSAATIGGGEHLWRGAFSPPRTVYNQTWEHHAAAFGSLDVAATCSDYVPDSHIIVVDQPSATRSDYHGPAGCTSWFTTLFARLRGVDGKFTTGFAWADDSAPVVDGNVVFVSWTASSPSYVYHWATDTLVMDADGRFTHHHIFANGSALVV